MKSRAINELAAILVREHGPQAASWTRRRQDRYAHDPGSELFRLWAAIAEAAARLLGEQDREASPADLSC